MVDTAAKRVPFAATDAGADTEAVPELENGQLVAVPGAREDVELLLR